jgi:hypothetical protein
VKAIVSGCGAGKDAVNDTGGTNLVRRCGGCKAEESSGCESKGSESDHDD